MRETVIWTISLPPQMAEKAEEAARRESRTRSELVREALRQYMAAREWSKCRLGLQAGQKRWVFLARVMWKIS